jgi:hypothetical protein
MEKERSQQEERIKVVREVMDFATDLKKLGSIDSIDPYRIKDMADKAFQIEIDDHENIKSFPQLLINLETLAGLLMWAELDKSKLEYKKKLFEEGKLQEPFEVDLWRYEFATRLVKENGLEQFPLLAIHLADKHLHEPYRSQMLEEVIKKVKEEECWSPYEKADLLTSAASPLSVDNPNRNQYLKEAEELYLKGNHFAEAFVYAVSRMYPPKVKIEEAKQLIKIVMERHFPLVASEMLHSLRPELDEKEYEEIEKEIQPKAEEVWEGLFRMIGSTWNDLSP